MASSAGSTSPSSHAAAGKALASSGRPTGTAIMRLCDELEAVRSAWKQEGAQLRARIRQLHDARLAAEAKAADAEARLKAHAAAWRDERSKLEARNLQADMLAEQRDVYRRQTQQQHEKEVEQLMIHSQELSRHVTEAQAALKASDDAHRQAATEVDALTARLQATEAECERRDVLRDRARAEVEALQQDLGRCQVITDNMEQRLARHEADHRQKVADLQAQLAAARAQADASRAAVESTLAESHAQLQAERQAASRRFLDHAAELDRANARVAGLKAENDALREALGIAEDEFASVADVAQALAGDGRGIGGARGSASKLSPTAAERGGPGSGSKGRFPTVSPVGSGLPSSPLRNSPLPPGVSARSPSHMRGGDVPQAARYRIAGRASLHGHISPTQATPPPRQAAAPPGTDPANASTASDPRRQPNSAGTQQRRQQPQPSSARPQPPTRSPLRRSSSPVASGDGTTGGTARSGVSVRVASRSFGGEPSDVTAGDAGVVRSLGFEVGEAR